MAFREIEPDPLAKFFKFEAIGDRLMGVFVRYEKRTANFNDGPKEVEEYTFRDQKGELWTITAGGSLAGQLRKAQLKPGYKVLIQFKATQDTGRPAR
jgi:hypothetical protein